MGGAIRLADPFEKARFVLEDVKILCTAVPIPVPTVPHVRLLRLLVVTAAAGLSAIAAVGAVPAVARGPPADMVL